MAGKSPPFAWAARFQGSGGMVLALAVVLSVLLGGDFLPDNVFFSNDGPLGRLMAECHRLPGRFFGCWEDLNHVGIRAGGIPPGISAGLQLLLGPVLFSKLYVPIALMILALGAWTCFRQWGLAPLACLAGGLAAALNSGFFSTACWGIAAHPITVGMTFFAVAALSDTTSRLRWVRVILAGFAVGMGVTEGADVGALFSLMVAAYVFYQACGGVNRPSARNIAVGMGRLALVSVCAVLLAAQVLSGIITTDIEGVAGTEQNQETRTAHWDWATQWSLPKSETLSLVVPGLFGYRFDTPNGGNYWGAIGRDPAWDRYYAGDRQGPTPAGLQRYVGGGSYVGVTVALVAAWAAVQSFRRKDSVFAPARRRMLWFWVGMGMISLLLAYGRFAPFYAFLYKLPYFSTIRNPVKFLHLLAMAIVVLFANGVDGLWRTWVRPVAPGIVPPRRAGLGSWWARAPVFDKRWVLGCLLVLGLSLIGWSVYATSHTSLEQHLQDVQFSENEAPVIAAFSIHQVMWFVLFFALTAYLMVLYFSGSFTGQRAGWGGALLCLLVVADLGRADLPWIVFWNYKVKYASNPIIDVLREKPWEHRVAVLPLRQTPQPSQLERLYKEEWLQHQFPYFNIQSLDIVQMSRAPEDLVAFGEALRPRAEADRGRLLTRNYELTSTRYLLGQSEMYGFLNLQVDPGGHRFRLVKRFNLAPKPGVIYATLPEQITAQVITNGAYALYEFTGALPRARLYGNWTISTNDDATLKQLADASFDPQQTVLVSGKVPEASPHGANQSDGTADFVSYASKNLVIKTVAPDPAVLLLNDRYDPGWDVFVDGRPDTLLRCNYLMRGVYLKPGTHEVEFRLRRSVGFLYVSLGAIIAGLLLLGVVVLVQRRNTTASLPRGSTRPPPPTPSAGEKAGRSPPNRQSAKSKSRAPNSKPQPAQPAAPRKQPS